MTDTERRPLPLPWWAEAGLRFIERFGFPAALAIYLLVSFGARMDSLEAAVHENTSEIRELRAEIRRIVR